jgi:hypothetical protein
MLMLLDIISSALESVSVSFVLSLLPGTMVGWIFAP